MCSVSVTMASLSAIFVVPGSFIGFVCFVFVWDGEGGGGGGGVEGHLHCCTIFFQRVAQEPRRDLKREVELGS